MSNTKKSLANQPIKADAADIKLINQFSMKELTPDDVFCFNVSLCNNDVDRDMERFTDEALDGLAKLFTGKPGISDHRWSAEKQVARIYRCEVVDEPGKKTALGTQYKYLRASAYMLRTNANKKMIDAIEGGIIKEVSVGCAMAECNCSVCGEPINTCGHRKGETYDGKLCCGVLSDPVDAYEFSFVAVPAQPGAGVTKGADDIAGAFELLMTANLSGEEANIKKLMPVLQSALMDAAERLERETIRKNAEKILSVKEGK